MAENKKSRKSLFGMLAAAGAIKAGVFDVPKGSVEYAVQHRMNRLLNKTKAEKFSLGKLLRPITRRGLPRAAGGVTVGALTFPVFASGMADVRSGDKRRKRIGVAKILGSGAVYTGGRGGVEYALESVQGGGKFSGKALAGVFGRAFKARAIPGTAAAALTAYAVSRGLKKKDESKDKSWKRVLPFAVAGGAGAAALKQLPETVYYTTPKGLGAGAYLKTLKNVRSWAPRVTGRAVAGGLGGGVLGIVMSKVMDRMKKERQKK